MKILFFSSIVWDGYRVQNHELPVSLSERSHDCVFVNPIRYRNWENGSVRLQSHSKNEQYGVRTIERRSRIPKSFLLLLYENFQNTLLIRENKPDVVVSFDYMMSLFACLYCKYKKIRFVYVLTDDWEEIEKSGLLKLYLRYIIKPVLGKFSFAITSTSHKQAIAFKIYNRNVHVIPNGKPVDFIKRSQGFVNNRVEAGKIVNFVSALRDWYDYDLLFDVFREFPEIELNIYGTGELYGYLVKQAEIYPNVKLRGNAPAELLPELIAESLFGILPLKLNRLNDSTCPIKLFDYWAAGKAVIASPVHELKVIGENGGLLFAATKEEYVNCINLILNDSNLRKSIGQQGYTKVLQKYNYDSISSAFNKLISL